AKSLEAETEVGGGGDPAIVGIAVVAVPEEEVRGAAEPEMAGAVESDRGAERCVAAPAVTRDNARGVERIRGVIFFVETAAAREKLDAMVMQRQDTSDAEGNPEHAVADVGVVIRAANFGTEGDGGIDTGFKGHV